MPEVTRVSESDRLFAQPQQRVADFVFNEDVVRVFPDMIKRSVPGYPTIVENIGVLGAQFAQPNSVLYDLGCSLGAVTQSLRRHVRNDGCRVIRVDNSHAMIERCSEYLHAQDAMYQELLPVELIEADILALDLQPTSLVAMNFTLQFVAPDQRLGLLRRIRQALLPGGALILRRNCASPMRRSTRCSPTCTSPSSVPTATASWRSRRSAARWKTSCSPTPSRNTVNGCWPPASARSANGSSVSTSPR